MQLLYFIYFYKIKIDYYSAEIIKIAVAMGATISVLYFIWLVYSLLVTISGEAFLFMQQCVIMASFLQLS